MPWGAHWVAPEWPEWVSGEQFGVEIRSSRPAGSNSKRSWIAIICGIHPPSHAASTICRHAASYAASLASPSYVCPSKFRVRWSLKITAPHYRTTTPAHTSSFHLFLPFCAHHTTLLKVGAFGPDHNHLSSPSPHHTTLPHHNPRTHLILSPVPSLLHPPITTHSRPSPLLGWCFVAIVPLWPFAWWGWGREGRRVGRGVEGGNSA